MSDAAPIDRPRERLLAAILEAAQKRQTSAVPTPLPDLPWLTLITLPDVGAGVTLVERGDGGPEELRARLDRLLSAHAQGLLFLVLVGGGEADRAVLTEADKRAPDPNKLGVYHLDDAGRLDRVAGRRSGILAEARAGLREARPLAPEAIDALGEAGRRDQQEAAAFAASLQGRPHHATRLLGAACIVYYILAQVWGRQSFGETVLDMGANSAPLVRAGEAWRLLSYAFLHANFVHLAFNLVALISFGGFLEPILGWRRFLLLYGLSALGGGLASALAGVEASVGASGAVWGLMTAGVALLSLRQALVPRRFVQRLRPRLLVVLAVNAAFSLLPLVSSNMPRIDLYAHAGGGLVGFVLVAPGLLTRGLGVPGRPDPLALRIAALVMLGLLAGSIALALSRGQPWHQVGAI